MTQEVTAYNRATTGEPRVTTSRDPMMVALANNVLSASQVNNYWTVLTLNDVSAVSEIIGSLLGQWVRKAIPVAQRRGSSSIKNEDLMKTLTDDPSLGGWYVRLFPQELGKLNSQPKDRKRDKAPVKDGGKGKK